MATPRRLLAVLLASLLVLLLALAVVPYVFLRSTLPPTSGIADVAGLTARVEIDFDTMGVPHIWAETEGDAYLALGWQHAADRLFQMELLRRSASGTLAELFGEVALESDIEQRRVGHRRMALDAVTELREGDRARVEAYVAGVNGYLALGTRPFEFHLLRTTVAPWTVEDVLAIGSFQAWYSDDLSDSTFLIERVLDGLDRGRARTLLPGGTAPGWVSHRMLPDRDAVAGLVASLKMSIASNAWAVSSARSASGAALLASDPHTQGPDLPGLWYIVGLHAADTGLGVVGVTAPGVPGVAMGHTRDAAWAITSSGVDLRDHYIERVHPDDDRQYLTPDGWRPFDVRAETIHVRGRVDPVVVEVKWTRHGPVVREDPKAHRAVAWRWAGHDFSPAALVAASLRLPHLREWEDFWEAAANAGAGAFNWVFASGRGRVAYGMGSPVPIRGFADSVLPIDGATNAREWQGYYPPELKAQLVSPPAGWVANTNNRPDTSELGYTLTGLGFNEDRILRLRQLLLRKPSLDVSDMIAAQLDQVDAYVLRWRDLAVRACEGLGAQAPAGALRAWDGSMAPGSTEAAVFNVWLDALGRAIFVDEFGGPAPRPHLEAALADASSPWWDDTRTPEVETASEVMQRAMAQALEETAGRAWGELHHLVFAHPMAPVPVIGGLLRLRRGPFPWGGSPGSLNASFYRRDPAGGFLQGNSPGWRGIVDFNDLDNALMVLPAGQSGNPASSHFFDFWPLWRAGRYWTVPLTRERVLERHASTLVLRPAGHR